MRQSGDNNVCPSCGERFRSSRSFDTHRTGTYGASGPNGYLAAERRCRSPEEMQQAGMQRNGRGLWVTKGFNSFLHSYPAAAAVESDKGM
jgi:hypothetical protein